MYGHKNHPCSKQIQQVMSLFHILSGNGLESCPDNRLEIVSVFSHALMPYPLTIPFLSS